jgi:hypothetical protein
VSQFKYLGTTITNQNLIQEEIKKRLNSGNACYHSVQNLLSSCLLSKNIKIRIYKTIILSLSLSLVSDYKSEFSHYCGNVKNYYKHFTCLGLLKDRNLTTLLSFLLLHTLAFSFQKEPLNQVDVETVHRNISFENNENSSFQILLFY